MKIKRNINTSKIIRIISIVIIVAISMAILTPSVRGENVGGTAAERADEKTMVRMTASISRAKESTNVVKKDSLASELDKYAGVGITTVTEKTTEVLVVTFTETGNQYEINKATGMVYEDDTAPTITVLPESSTPAKTRSITITAEDTGSELATVNSYEYYLSTSETSFVGGEWTTYKNGKTFTVGTGKTGTYYLFVKRVADEAGNISISGGTAQEVDGVTYQRFGSYIFDNSAPTIAVSPSSATVCTTKSVTITITEVGLSGLNTGNSYQYYLSSSSTKLESGSWINYTSGTPFTIGTGITGTRY